MEKFVYVTTPRIHERVVGKHAMTSNLSTKWNLIYFEAHRKESLRGKQGSETCMKACTTDDVNLIIFNVFVI